MIGNFSMADLMQSDYEDSYEPLIDLDEYDESSSSSDEIASPMDLLSIVLDETDKENTVRKALSDTDDILGLKEIYLSKNVELESQSKKGKMTDQQLSSITNRSNKVELTGLNFSSQVAHGLLQAGLNRIWEIDGEYQSDILHNFMKDIRGVPSEYLDKYVDRLRSVGAFFNPNDDYMREVFGSEITQSQYGIYNDVGENRYTMRLMMPLRFFDNSIVGFVGYSPVENTEGRTIKYLYPRKEILEKSRILATEVEVMKKSIEEGYICLTDGYFDAFSLNVYGINAASLCGSAVTKYHKLFLSKIKTKIIIPDNDKAGTKLESTIKSLWPNSRAIHQTETKDIDEFLGNYGNIEKICSKFESWKSRGFLYDLNLV